MFVLEFGLEVEFGLVLVEKLRRRLQFQVSCCCCCRRLRCRSCYSDCWIDSDRPLRANKQDARSKSQLVFTIKASLLFHLLAPTKVREDEAIQLAQVRVGARCGKIGVSWEGICWINFSRALI